MKKSALEQIKARLLEDKKRLEAELAQFTTKNPHNPNDYDTVFPDLGDKEEENASEVAAYSDNLTLERTLESSLRDVRKALERISSGDYGMCRYCRKPIDEKRLLARPTSSSHVECKQIISSHL